MEKHIQSGDKGLYTDANEEFQPEGSYRFMLNGNRENLLGELGSVSNERGNRKILNLPTDLDDYVIIGSCLLPNNDTVLFITNGEVDIIALHKANNTYEELIRTNCLEFTKCDQIDCQFRIHRGCNTILYFTDTKTKYKSINISNLDNYKIKGYTNTLPNTDPDYTNPNIPDADGNYGWNCGSFFLNPEVLTPNITLNIVNSGGTLRIGSYEFFVRLLDSDLNASDWVQLSNPVYVNGPFRSNNIYDNHNGYLGTAELDGYYYTDKSILIDISNIDTDYKFINIGVAEKAAGSDTYTNGYISTNIQIQDTNYTYLFDNVLSPALITIDPTLFNIPSKKIGIVAAHAQAENRLLVANIEETITDYVEFQRAANDIKVEYVTYNTLAKSTEVCNNNPNWKYISTGYGAFAEDPLTSDRQLIDFSDPWLSHNAKVYMRDEIYALGIVWVFTDGTESPVFHIPGRLMFGEPDSDVYPIGGNNWTPGMFTDTYIIDGFDYANDALTTSQAGGGNVYWDSWARFIGLGDSSFHKELDDTMTTSLDDDIIRYGFNFNGFGVMNQQGYSCCEWFITDDTCDNSLKVPTWRMHNTAYRRGDISGFNDPDAYSYLVANGHRGVPGYYDTNTKYPDILACDGKPIFPYDEDVDGNITMHNIRHHRMPDCVLEPIMEQVLFDNDFAVPESGGPGATEAQLIYQMKHAEKTLRLNNLGIITHNVVIPEGFEDKVLGYYIVRGDRAGNKTVIDKGWFNISDTTRAVTPDKDWSTIPPVANGLMIDIDIDSPDAKYIEQNLWFLTWLNKNSQRDYLTGEIIPLSTDPLVSQKSDNLASSYQNIFEFQSPKVRINELTNLGGDYINLEQTVYGDMFILGIPSEYTYDLVTGTDADGKTFPMQADKVNPDDSRIFKAGLAVFLNRNRFPRVFSHAHRDGWIYTRTLPILTSEYAVYNLDAISALIQNFTIDNDKLRQRSLLLQHKNSCNTQVSLNTVSAFGVDRYTDPVNPNFICDFTLPFAYSYPPNTGTDYTKWDITTHNTADDIVDYPPNGGFTPLSFIQAGIAGIAGFTPGFSVPNIWACDDTAKYNGDTNSAFVVSHSPYMYYAALKRSIQPYSKLDNIFYTRTGGYVIDKDRQVDVVLGGDCFITRFQADKFYYDTRPGEVADSDFSFAASLIVGYVESEVNAHYRHIKGGELYKVWPYNDVVDSYWTTPAKSFTFDDDGNLIQEGAWEFKYNYRLDFSADSDKTYAGLSDDYKYCSSCQESFPHTIRYSDQSSPEQIFDAYKNFSVNSIKEIPSDTGVITNMFVKENNVFVHTENNLWRINIAPQQLQTGGDTIQVGQGNFLGLTPTKLFDNKEGIARGGSVHKFSGAFCEDNYIWVDARGRNVFMLNKGLEDISSNGLSRWFINNLSVNLDEQYMQLTNNSYPHTGTSCNISVGYRACYDPEHGRYILTKKDFKILDGVLEGMEKYIKGETEVIEGNHYYTDEGFFTATGNGEELVEFDFYDKDLAENKSWTISLALATKSWLSFHSYIPNWLYNNSDTFFTFIANDLDDRDMFVWEHNYADFQTYYDNKFDFVIDYIYKKDGYAEFSNDTVEYTSNVYVESTQDGDWINVPFNTFSTITAYNNDQISNMKEILVGNLSPYSELNYTTTQVTAHKQRNFWRINKLRDFAIDRLNLLEPLFSKDWLNTDYSDYFDKGFGYIDKIINPNIIDLTKSVYEQQRFTDKYFGVRLTYKPEENYKLIINLLSGLKRNKI